MDATDDDARDGRCTITFTIWTNARRPLVYVTAGVVTCATKVEVVDGCD